MPRHTVRQLKVLVAEELAKGRIFEAQIIGSNAHVEGLCSWETGEITVNPSPSVVDTLIHELLHRRFPKWCEERVRLETWRVMKQMSDDDVRVWYRKYKRQAKKKSTPVRVRNAEI